MSQVQSAGAAAVEHDLPAHGEPAVAPPLHPHWEVCCSQSKAPAKHASAVQALRLNSQDSLHTIRPDRKGCMQAIVRCFRNCNVESLACREPSWHPQASQPEAQSQAKAVTTPETSIRSLHTHVCLSVLQKTLSGLQPRMDSKSYLRYACTSGCITTCSTCYSTPERYWSYSLCQSPHRTS